jgi:hypothetical protein
MLGNGSLPRHPPRSKSKSLCAFVQGSNSTEVERGMQAQKSGTHDSLLGSSIKSRQDAVELTAEEGGESTPKETNCTTKTAKEPLRTVSPKPEQRSRRGGSRSPTTSPNSAQSKSPREEKPTKYRPKSPRTNHTNTEAIAKSSHHSAKKSPKRRSPRAANSPNGKSPRGGKNESLSVTAKAKQKLDDSFPDLALSAKTRPTKSLPDAEDDVESVPGLVDDSVIRETLEGNRGGKKWNIMEDSPGGHAPEKLIIIPGVEHSDEESGSWMCGFQEGLDEDDDIVDDPGMIDNVARRRNILPTDPSALATSVQAPRAGAGRDRFDPSFKNSDMWATDDDNTARFPSGDVSLLSDVESGDLSEDVDMSEHEEIDDDKDGASAGLSSVDMTNTPATKKRSGGRQRPADMEAVPNVEDDSPEDDDIIDDPLRHPASVPEDGPLDGGSKKKSRRKKKSPSSKRSSGRGRQSGSHDKKGSNSGRSSGRQSTTLSSRRRSAGLERNAMRTSARNRTIPETIPGGEASSCVRSPMTVSSQTSTPSSTSWVSSVRQQQQAQSLQSLRQQHSQQYASSPPRRRANKPLNLHVERARSPPANTDDYTLGASTITTNFSTTQRTLNTVSSRSLFRTEKMSHSETLKMPTRKRADSESDESDDEKLAPTKKEEIEERTFNLQNSVNIQVSAELEESLDEPLDRKAPLREPSSEKKNLKTALRRPSAEGDDLLAMVNGTKHSQSTGSDVSEGSLSLTSSFLHWQKENGDDLISPHASFQRLPDVKDLGTSKSFLQLNPAGAEGVLVDAGIAVAPDLKSPLHIPGRIDEMSSSTALEVGHAPDLGRRIFGGGQHSPGASTSTPTDLFSKKKRKSRLGLLRRVQSWKGVVALSDDED